MWTTLLQPDDTALLICPVIWLSTAANIFVPQLSLFTDAPAMRVYSTALCILHVSWIMLFFWLRWVHIAALDLMATWLSLLPIYLHSTQAADGVSWLQFVGGHLAIRLCFSWVSVGVTLYVSISWQTQHGGFLPFGAYASKLAVLLTTVLSGIVLRHDNVIGSVAIWSLFWLFTHSSRQHKRRSS